MLAHRSRNKRAYDSAAVYSDPVSAWGALQAELASETGLPSFEMAMKMEQVRLDGLAADLA